MTDKNKKTDMFSAPWPWYIVIYTSYMAAPFAISWLTSPELFTDAPLAASFFSSQKANNLLLYVHIFFAVPPILIGPFLFHEQLRNNNFTWHKHFGKIYIIACLSAAATGLCLAIGKEYWVSQLGFSSLAVAWFMTSWLAYIAVAKRRDFKAHRRWMLRSFALTFAFVNVKLIVIVQSILTPDLSQSDAVAIRSWLGWVPLLVIIESYIQATDHRGKYLFLKKLRKKKAAPKPPPAPDDH